MKTVNGPLFSVICYMLQATIYVYQLVNDEVKVEKIEHTKAGAAAPVAA